MRSETASPPDSRAHIGWAIAWMMGALVSFTLVAIAGRAAARGVDTLQLTIWRSLIGLAVLCMILPVRGGGLGGIATRRFGLHSTRNLIHWVGQFCWLYALTRLPLSELIALEFTTPLWVALLAPLLLGERMTLPRFSAALLGFVGILIVVRPGAIPLSEGTPFGVACAIAFALSMLATKRLLHTESAYTILFWMQGIQTVLGLLIAYAGVMFGYDKGLVIPDLITFLWLIPVGVLGLTAHYSLAKAISYADATIVAPMDFLRLPLFALIGVLVYAEPLDPWVFAGGALVVLANFLNLQSERRRAA